MQDIMLSRACKTGFRRSHCVHEHSSRSWTGKAYGVSTARRWVDTKPYASLQQLLAKISLVGMEERYRVYVVQARAIARGSRQRPSAS